MISVRLSEAELRRHNACDDGDDPARSGMALYRAIARLQYPDVADPPCIIVREWTQLHTVWLHSVYPSHASWLEARGLVPRANLSGAYLDGAYLRGAYLRGANLRDAYRPIDPPPGWAHTADGYLRPSSTTSL